MTPLSDSEAATVRRLENAEPAPESWGGGRLCLCGKPEPDPVHHRPQTSEEEHLYEPSPTQAEFYGAAVSGDDGLREAIARALHHDWHADEEWGAIPDSVQGYYRRLADVTLALPELAALRAKADAADRVRELAEGIGRGEPAPARWVAEDVIRALDGPSPC